MTLRVRGIYTTALTGMFEEIVQPSSTINDRFDDSFSHAPADVIVETTPDRQGVCVHDTAGTTAEGSTDVATVVSRLHEQAIDTLAWRAALPRGGIVSGEVVETMGSGVLVDCGQSFVEEDASLPFDGKTAGFLPYSNVDDRVTEGESLRVQVTEVRPPWEDGHPVLDTEIRVDGGLASLLRKERTGTGGPELAEIVPSDPPAGWSLEWDETSEKADLDELSAVIDSLSARATDIDEALDGTTTEEGTRPALHTGDRTRWFWFGRESRFALDETRREVTTTMPGHHRIKAGNGAASAAVDFVEAVCDPGNGEFPFEAVTQQFGPRKGDSVSIGHGKPDGRLLELGSGSVVEVDSDGTVTLEREIRSSGTYDALGTERSPGDVATTRFTEGRWWYPTVYRSDGTAKGTYVNVCTPVEIFPTEVRYVDLHVDVIKRPDGSIERVDEDELAAAVDAGSIPEPLAEKARTIARAVENAFS